MVTRLLFAMTYEKPRHNMKTNWSPTFPQPCLQELPGTLKSACDDERMSFSEKQAVPLGMPRLSGRPSDDLEPAFQLWHIPTSGAPGSLTLLPDDGLREGLRCRGSGESPSSLKWNSSPTFAVSVPCDMGGGERSTRMGSDGEKPLTVTLTLSRILKPPSELVNQSVTGPAASSTKSLAP